MRAWICQLFKATLGLLFVALALAICLSPVPATAQQPTTFGSASDITCPDDNTSNVVIVNGSTNFLTTELFFEPETPPQSLKGAPTTWNELEQLLDNPYLYTWGAACNDGKGLVTGSEQGFPTYCTTSLTATNNPGGFIRRPTFSAVTLPPL